MTTETEHQEHHDDAPANSGTEPEQPRFAVAQTGETEDLGHQSSTISDSPADTSDTNPRRVRHVRSGPERIPPPGSTVDLDSTPDSEDLKDEDTPDREDSPTAETDTEKTPPVDLNKDTEETSGGDETRDADESDQGRTPISERLVVRTPTPRQSMTEWIHDLTSRRYSALTNLSAAAAGAWGFGLFTMHWETGLPQIFLYWMHSSAADSTHPVVPFVIGGLCLLGSLVVGGLIYAKILKLVGASAKASAAFHWLLIRVPAMSAFIAIGLYEPRSL